LGSDQFIRSVNIQKYGMTLHRHLKQNGITHAGSNNDQMENTQYKKFIIKYYIFSHISQIISFDITSNKVLHVYEWNN